MNDKKYSSFGIRLDSLRISGEKKQDFSIRIGVARTNLSKYYQGRVPDPDILERISRATGVNIGWLLTGEGPKFTADHIINDALEGVYGPLEAEEAAYEAEKQAGRGGIARPYASPDPEVRVWGAKITRKLSPEAVARIMISHLDLLDLDRYQAGLVGELIIAALTDPERRDQLLDYFSYLKGKKKP